MKIAYNEKCKYCGLPLSDGDDRGRGTDRTFCNIDRNCMISHYNFLRSMLKNYKPITINSLPMDVKKHIFIKRALRLIYINDRCKKNIPFDCKLILEKPLASKPLYICFKKLLVDVKREQRKLLQVESTH